MATQQEAYKAERTRTLRLKKRTIRRVPREDIRVQAAEEEAEMQEEMTSEQVPRDAIMRRDPLHPDLPPEKLNKRGDRRGMHLKDQPRDSDFYKKIRSMRKIYNKQMPVLACNTCSFSSSCPKFRAGYECYYIPFLRSHNVTDERSLLDEMKNLVSANMSRLHLAKTFETLGGGTPSLEVTEASTMVFSQMKDLYELMTDIEEEDAEFEENSIIGQLFGNVDMLAEHTKSSLDEIKKVNEKDRIERAKREQMAFLEADDIRSGSNLLDGLAKDAEFSRTDRFQKELAEGKAGRIS